MAKESQRYHWNIHGIGIGFDDARSFQPVHFGQHDIHENEVRPFLVLPYALQLPVPRLIGFHSESLQEIADILRFLGSSSIINIELLISCSPG